MDHNRLGYWISEAGDAAPRPPLDGATDADVLIVGGGFSGLWCAWYAKQLEPGARVVLLESEPLCGRGPSGRNGGFCHAMWLSMATLRARFGDAPALAVADAAGDAVDRVEAFCAEQEVDAWFTRAGAIEVSTAPAHDSATDAARAACAALGRADVMVVATVLFLLEMFADKIPYLDSAWDTVHTVIRPLVGATIGYLIGHESSSLAAAFGAATGGFSALAAHLVKAGTRAAVNTSPEPVSNVVVSTGEDVTVAGVVSLAFLNPWVAAAIAAVILVVGAVLVVYLLRRVRRWRQRYDEWGERHGLAPPRETDPEQTQRLPGGSSGPG